MDSSPHPSTSEFNPFEAVMYLMAKPVGAKCNMRCSYCYYLEKDSAPALRTRMSDTTLEEFVRQYIEAQTTYEVIFTWHGGEATLAPLSFYEKAMELQQRYAGGRRILNCLQTNGSLINAAWCTFLRRHGWLVGVSVDGPAYAHDRFRRSASGRPTHLSVMRAIRMLQHYGVEWNAMAVINSVNVEKPEEFYDFFKQIGCSYIQFTPIVERRRPDGRLATVNEEGTLTPESVTPAQWGDFLCRLFDCWVQKDVGKVYVQIFDATLAGWVGVTPGVCSMAKVCGHAGVVDYNGDVYGCDHFVFPGYRLGNIHENTVIELMSQKRQFDFGLAKRASLPGQCLRCPYTMICNGECPKNRFAISADGEAGLNYLCEGYRKFFSHTEPHMRFMAEQLRRNQPPAAIMDTPLVKGD